MERRMEYKNEGSGNCLRVSCGEEIRNLYSYKMITGNTIKGLLPCHTRVMDGETFFYYELSSGQTLHCRYEEKEIDYNALEKIFMNIVFLGRELQKFLLDLKYVYFDEKYIFQNIETGETNFMYIPDKTENEGSFNSFMEYIVTRINHTDTKAIQTAYQLYEVSKRQGIFLAEIEKLFEEKRGEEKIKEKPQIEEKPYIKESVWMEPDIQTESKNDYGNIETIAEQEGKREKKGELADRIVPCLFVVFLTGFICIKIYFPLGYTENVLLVAAGIVGVSVFIVYEIYRYMYRKNIKKEGEEKEFLQKWDRNNPAKEYTEREKEVVSDYQRGEMAGYYYNINEVQEETKIHAMKETEQYSEVFGRTVFFEPEAENILCGLGKHEKITINLEKFPFTIGKIATETDYVLTDKSISRLHARIYREEKQVYIMDLNSTNGTCKNGFRIPPNEKILIEEGDEISLGKIRFCYR